MTGQRADRFALLLFSTFRGQNRPTQPVPFSPNGIDQFFILGKVHLFPQVVYVDINQVAIGFKLVSPALAQQFRTTYGVTATTQEHVKQIKFLGTEFDLTLSTVRFATGRVKLKI